MNGEQTRSQEVSMQCAEILACRLAKIAGSVRDRSLLGFRPAPTPGPDRASGTRHQACPYCSIGVRAMARVPTSLHRCRGPWPPHAPHCIAGRLRHGAWANAQARPTAQPPLLRSGQLLLCQPSVRRRPALPAPLSRELRQRSTTIHVLHLTTLQTPSPRCLPCSPRFFVSRQAYTLFCFCLLQPRHHRPS